MYHKISPEFPESSDKFLLEKYFELTQISQVLRNTILYTYLETLTSKFRVQKQ